MKKASFAIVSVLCGAILANAGALPSTYGGRTSSSYYYGVTPDGSGGFFDEWIAGKLSIGLSVSSVSLTDNKRPPNREQDFLGNINELKQEDSVQVFPTVNYRPIEYLLLGLSYAKVEARTMNFNNHESDGNASLKGPVFTAEAAYPLWDELAIPHVGLGLAFLAGDFDEDDWWGAGYGAPEDYEIAGHDKNRYFRHRYIDVDDQTCAFFNIGVSCRPIKNLLLDVSYRKLSLDPDCEFGYAVKGRKYMESTGDFDMSCNVFLFSVSYVF